jgi:3-oxoisoapionate decarboxylase
VWQGSCLLTSNPSDAMPDSPERIPYALTAYGLPHMMGYLATRSGDYHPAPLGVFGLMDTAVELGLEGVEFSIPSPDLIPTEAIQEGLQERGLRIVSDFMVLLDEEVGFTREYLKRSAAVGATVVRAILSRILCGDRRSLEGGWQARFTAIGARLNEVLPYAEDLGLCIAMENHQDATADDLLALAEMARFSPAYGITLDTGNPLAVGEEPVETARKWAPFIRHVHLKDYTIHFAPEGYRLVRCAAGDGVIDFPAILKIVRANGHDVLPGIEIAAQPTRTIPLLEDGWWDCYPPRPANNLVGALRILWKHGRPEGEPFSSAWERGENSETVAAEEWDVVRRSVEYFRGLSNKD